jgi:hypothetical protein
MNPICSDDNPVIVVRNNGKNPITNLRISYGGGEELSVYDWTSGIMGPIKFMDTAVITLPNAHLSASDSIFTVALEQPGVTDDNPRNNTMSTHYRLPKSFSGVIYLTMRTDDYANALETTNGISYKVVDVNDNVIYQKGDFADNTAYRDTFRLHNGCYSFIITDDYIGDGLLAIQGTSGLYTLKDDQNHTIISAIADAPNYLASFGNREITPFVVTGSSDVEMEPSDAKSELLIYPNPTAGLFTVEFPQSVHGKGVTVQAYSATGEEVFSKSLTTAPSSMAVDFSGHVDGVYMVKVTAGEVVWGRKVVVGRK